MLRTALAAVIVLMTAACASVATRPVRVEVEEVAASDRWRVTIHHPRATDAFVFPNSRHRFRSAKWSIIEPVRGAYWSTINGHDAVVLDRPASRITLDFPSDFSFFEKDYTLNVPFTDGSRLLYTGHLRTRAHDDKRVLPHVWTFTTSPTRPIRIFGQSGVGRLEWAQPSVDETFVYFGSIVPEPTPRMTLIVDPGLPEWVETQMRDLIPRQFDFFARMTRAELPFTPLIVVTYGGSKGSGRTFAGHGLQGMLAITISGEQWMPKTPDAEEYWFRHLAHEAFHLWGAQAYRHVDEAEWLSESMAEYASLLASADAGVMSPRHIAAFLDNAMDECAQRLNATPLRESLGPGQSRNVYTCGVLLQKVVDDAARRGGSDIWSVWRATYSSSRPYTTADFLRAVRDVTSDEAIVDLVDEVVNRGLKGDPRKRLQRAPARPPAPH